MVDIHFNKDKGSELKLFTPGPVQVPKRVLNALDLPNDTHRSQFYSEMHKMVKEGLQKVLYTQNKCLIYTSSATGIMEACVRGLIKDDEKALFLSIGAFGDRWHEIGVANEKQAIKTSIEMGKAVTPEILKEELSKDKYSVILLQANETSTGVYNPLDDIVPIMKDHGALVCVDATSSMAGVKLEVDKLNIDICLASVQKCFALPPGLAVCSISQAAIDKASQVKNRGYYLDFLPLLKKDEVNQTPTTPPIPQIRALAVQLDYILNDEGLENRFIRHSKLGLRTRMWARDMDLEMLPEKGFESNTVSTIKNTHNINTKEMVSTMLEKGYRIVNGYGSLVNKTFRIGHMGEITIENLEEMLKVLTDVIADLRLKQ